MARAHLDDRVGQARRADHLLHDNAAALGQLILGRSGADVDGLRREGLKFVERLGPVVECGRQSEAVFDERLLARAVAAIHGANLRHGDMAFVDDEQKVLRKIVQQTKWALTRAPSVQVTRIVFDARAVAQLLNHLQIVRDALLEPLGLEGFAHLLQLLHAFAQVEANLPERRVDALLGGDEEVGGIDLKRVLFVILAPVDRVK